MGFDAPIYKIDEFYQLLRVGVVSNIGDFVE
jgi:hypothetical protein